MYCVLCGNYSSYECLQNFKKTIVSALKQFPSLNSCCTSAFKKVSRKYGIFFQKTCIKMLIYFMTFCLNYHSNKTEKKTTIGTILIKSVYKNGSKGENQKHEHVGLLGLKKRPQQFSDRNWKFQPQCLPRRLTLQKRA